MAPEFETGLPSIRQVQMLIREQTAVECKLLTGDVLTGSVVWQDTHAVCLSADGSTFILNRAAIAYLKISG